jgi:hypothetical protein
MSLSSTGIEPSFPAPLLNQLTNSDHYGLGFNKCEELDPRNN